MDVPILVTPLDAIEDKVMRRALQLALRDPSVPPLNKSVRIARGLTLSWNAERTCKEIHLWSYTHKPRGVEPDDASDHDFYTLTTQVYNDAIVMRAPLLGKQSFQYDMNNGDPAIVNFVPAMWQFLLREFRCSFGVYIDTQNRIGLRRERGQVQPEELPMYYNISEGTDADTALSVPISVGVWTIPTLQDILLQRPDVISVIRLLPVGLRDRAEELQAPQAKPTQVGKKLSTTNGNSTHKKSHALPVSQKTTTCI